MKQYTLLYIAAAAIAATACTVSQMPDNQQTRRITVSTESIGTKTGIEYEYSDYSHLVWKEGDVVAYVTDCASDVVRTAEVSADGRFTATIPETAGTDNKLYVVYPGEGLEGSLLENLKLEIPGTQVQNSICMDNSDGIVIPMLAATDVPSAGETSVSVRYEVPVSIVRFSFLSADFSGDQISSVAMTAAEPLCGTIDVSSYFEGDENFAGGSNCVTTEICNVFPIEKGGYVYVPVKRGSYSGVTLTVTTDNNEFEFSDGNFELDDPAATLYKTEVTLGETQIVKDPHFVEITEGEVFSADNSYLISYKMSDYSYKVATENYNSSKIDSKQFETDPALGGIPAAGEIMDYVFTIAPVDGAPDCYYLYSEAAGNTNGNYLGSAGGTSTAGNFFFMKTEPTADDTSYIWDISFGDGVQYVHNVGRDRWFKFSNDPNQQYFATSSVGEDNSANPEICDLTILKLID